MGLFEKKEFVMHSGDIGDFKIECDFLTDDDIETIAYIISKNMKFKEVVGVPTGGIRIENALKKYTSNEGYDILIVDDVLTTGNSMEKMKEKYSDRKFIGGVVIFARNECPYWIIPIFQMNIK